MQTILEKYTDQLKHSRSTSDRYASMMAFLADIRTELNLDTVMPVEDEWKPDRTLQEKYTYEYGIGTIGKI